MDPNFFRARFYLAMSYEQIGRYEDAIAECQKALSLGGEPGVLAVLGHVYAMSGRRAEAQKVLAQLKDLSKRRYVSPFSIALMYLGLEDKGQALEWLERAHEDHTYRLTWIPLDSRAGRSLTDVPPWDRCFPAGSVQAPGVDFVRLMRHQRSELHNEPHARREGRLKLLKKRTRSMQRNCASSLNV